MTTTPTVAPGSRADRRQTLCGVWVRAALVVLALIEGIPGVWAGFFPMSFYTRFPGDGTAWAALFPPYNEHLTRDFGTACAQFAVVAALAALWPRRRLVAGVAVAALTFGIPHLIFHQTHPMPSPDMSLQLASQVVPVVLAVAVLVTALRGGKAKLG